MSSRTTPVLSAEMRAILKRDLLAAAERERQATLDKYVLVAVAYEAGMTVRDIAAEFDTSPDTAKRWKDMGMEERALRQAHVPSDPGSGS